MNISYKGQSCFVIQLGSKEGASSIVIDPFDDKTGLKVPKLTADILLISHDHYDHNNEKAVSGDYFKIDGPGEYDVKSVFVDGIASFHDNSNGTERGINTIYVIEAEEMRVCHLGDLGQKELTAEQLNSIGLVDILMIPVGGTYTIDGSEAVKIMSAIEPKVIIPMHYKLPKLKVKLDGPEEFFKAVGIKKAETLPKLSIKRKDISEEEVKIIQLEP